MQNLLKKINPTKIRPFQKMFSENITLNVFAMAIIAYYKTFLLNIANLSIRPNLEGRKNTNLDGRKIDETAE